MTDFSYQLYSSRNFPPLRDTLKMLAGLGYSQVEGYGALLADPDAVADLTGGLAAAGLTMPTAHIGLDVLREAPQQAIALAKTLGISAVFAPFLKPDERPRDAAGWQIFGKTLGKLGEPLWDAGLVFGWHNHEFEFADLGGQDFPLDLILQGDERLALELDVAWVARGGQDPMRWIAQYSDRIAAVHVKDIAPEGEAKDEDGWADVGHGTLDWPGLMTALRKTDAQFFIMEHDNPSDHRRFAERSLEAAKSFEGN